MKRPKVSIENYDQVYSYFEQYRQPVRTTKLAYAVMDRVFHPTVLLAPGVDQELDDFRQNDTRQFMVFNHLSNKVDQFVAASIVRRIVPEDVGRTRVIAKDSVFNDPRYPRSFAEAMGTIPAFRTVDHGDKVPSQLVQRAATRLGECVNYLLTDGQNIASYQEGTNNKGERDPHTIGDIKPGIWHLTHQTVADGTPLALTFIGSSYGWTHDTLNPRDAISVVGNSVPITEDLSIDDLVAITSEGLQSAVTAAANARYISER